LVISWKINISQILAYRKTEEDGKIIILVKDVKGGEHELGPVNHVDLNFYVQGGHVQSAFPYLSVDERELIISGYTKEMWDDMVSGIGGL
jgi:hypothetical protein